MKNSDEFCKSFLEPCRTAECSAESFRNCRKFGSFLSVFSCTPRQSMERGASPRLPGLRFLDSRFLDSRARFLGESENHSNTGKFTTATAAQGYFQVAHVYSPLPHKSHVVLFYFFLSLCRCLRRIYPRSRFPTRFELRLK